MITNVCVMWTLVKKSNIMITSVRALIYLNSCRI